MSNIDSPKDRLHNDYCTLYNSNLQLVSYSYESTNIRLSEHLLFAKQAGWVLKSKVSGQNLTAVK